MGHWANAASPRRKLPPLAFFFSLPLLFFGLFLHLLPRNFPSSFPSSFFRLKAKLVCHHSHKTNNSSLLLFQPSPPPPPLKAFSFRTQPPPPSSPKRERQKKKKKHGFRLPRRPLPDHGRRRPRVRPLSAAGRRGRPRAQGGAAEGGHLCRRHRRRRRRDGDQARLSLLRRRLLGLWPPPRELVVERVGVRDALGHALLVEVLRRDRGDLALQRQQRPVGCVVLFFCVLCFRGRERERRRKRRRALFSRSLCPLPPLSLSL